MTTYSSLFETLQPIYKHQCMAVSPLEAERHIHCPARARLSLRPLSSAVSTMANHNKSSGSKNSSAKRRQQRQRALQNARRAAQVAEHRAIAAELRARAAMLEAEAVALKHK